MSIYIYNRYALNDNYFTEIVFENELCKCHNKKQSFPLCHVSIRSMKRKVGAFENYMHLMLDHEFTALILLISG